MKLLILGAGAVGGYFGARLIEAGADVTFLLRNSRLETVRNHGLQVSSKLGDIHVMPAVVDSHSMTTDFDLIILTCKSYSLARAIKDIKPAVGADTLILPFLNGVNHLTVLDQAFGTAKVLGGIAHLAVKLEADGEISHLNDFHRFIYGARHSDQEMTVQSLQSIMSKTVLEEEPSANIEQAMWEKFVFLATLAGATCLFRGSIGEILETYNGKKFILGLLQECMETATASGFTLSEKSITEYVDVLTETGSGYTASMLRDIESATATEADHILGDMVKRGEAIGVANDLAGYAWSHLQVYEMHRNNLN